VGIVKAKTKLMKRIVTADMIVDDIEDNKKHVVKFFAQQLYLMADLCLDRNYVSIRHIERMCPFELLITLLVHDKSPSIVKAPVCKMLRCVYVDRAPQVELVFPQLIRFGENAVRTDEPPDTDNRKFAMAQQILCEYFNGGLNLDQCDELSVEMVNLLLSLVSFGFYTTQMLLEDIVTPLTSQLNSHREVDTPENLTDTDASSVSNDSQTKGAYTASLTGEAKVLPESQESLDSFSERAIGRASSRRVLDTTAASDSQLRWQERVFTITESFYYNMAMLFLIVVSVAIVICTLVPWDEPVEVELALLMVDRVVTALFILDLTIRIYCNFIVNNEFASFFTELYKLIDVVVVSMTFFRLPVVLSCC
jgi:hypothetical protein